MKFNIGNNNLLCSAGKNYCHIFPNGDIYRCSTDHTFITNIMRVKENGLLKNLTCKREECNSCCDIDLGVKLVVDKCMNIIEKVGGSFFEDTFGAVTNTCFSEDSIVVAWIPTLSCNYKCSYCDGGSFSSELSDAEWEQGFSNLFETYKNVFISVGGGGEPFLRKKALKCVLDIVPTNCNFAFTTNLSLLDVDFLRLLKNKTVSFSCSIHPSCKTFNFDIFLGKVLMIKNNGHSVKVNFVGYPEQMFLYDYYKDIFNRFDIFVEYIPYSGNIVLSEIETKYSSELTPLNERNSQYEVYVPSLENIEQYQQKRRNECTPRL